MCIGNLDTLYTGLNRQLAHICGRSSRQQKNNLWIDCREPQAILCRVDSANLATDRQNTVYVESK